MTPRTISLFHADFDAHSIAPPVGGFEMNLTGRAIGAWSEASGLLDRCSITFGFDGGANVGHARIPERMVVFRVALSGLAPITAGRPLDRRSVAVHGPGAHLFEAVRGPSDWANLAVDPRLIEEYRAEFGLPAPIAIPGGRRVVEVSDPDASEIRRTLARAKSLVLHSPAQLDDPGTRALLQRDLVGAFAGAVARSKAPPSAGAAEAHHLRILVAAMEYLGATKTRVVKVSELRGVVRTSARTLTRVFHEAFRISPARYLTLRRLGQVRAHLLRGTPPPESVTRAALQFGFPELGRFSGAYKRLFGESPSMTLRVRRGR